jgi:predicted phage baseplate assembly protein
MNAPWWGKEASPAQQQQPVPQGMAPSAWPQLVAPTRDAVFGEVSGRIASYTAEWSSRRPGDAGIALARLFSEEMEPVLQRLNQLPENSFIQFLRTGGIRPRPPTPAEALLQFTVSNSATQSVSVPGGFQVGAPPAGGGNIVIFETNADLHAVPGTIQEMFALEHGLYRFIDPTQDNTPFEPFGKKPQPGLSFFIGISAGPSVIAGPQISFGIRVQGPAGLPSPVSTGGVAPLPAPLAPLLQWQVLDGATYREAGVIADETIGLTQSGVVSLRLPDTWRPGIPQGAPDTTPLLWLRLEIVYGSYPQPPVLLSVKLNVVRATAVQSFYNEVLAPVPGRAGGGTVMALSQTPVLPGSLILQVDDTADISFAGSAPNAATASTSAMLWTEVDDLAEFGPEDKVYALDPATGQVTFGDGIHGMAVPAGFRNVVALKYQVGGGSSGAVDAGKVSSPVNSVPFITGVQNPWPATGGMDAETQQQALQRGPKELRAHGRAVAVADYEILALRALGAQVARANAVAGFHPSFPGIPLPGVVCVFVIPPERGAGPPLPNDETLRAVSTFLSEGLAPLGIEVVAAAPNYHTVRVEVSVVVDPSSSRSDAVRSVLALLDTYLDPITGGDDGQGWPFGGTLSNAGLVRRLLTTVTGVTAVPSLIFIVDGVRGERCADFPISANSLVWPAGHEVLALGPGEEP